MRQEASRRTLAASATLPPPSAAAPTEAVRNTLFPVLVTTIPDEYGRVDILVSNAGITFKGGLETRNDNWQAVEYFSMKTDHYDRLIRGMQRLRQKLTRDQGNDMA